MNHRLVETPRLRLISGGIAASQTRSEYTALPDHVNASPSSGDRRVALALHEAQAAASSQPNVGTSREPLKSLDQIEELVRQSGWSRAFRTLKAQGLIEEQTLGHVIARWDQPGEGAAWFRSAARAELPDATSRAPSRIG